MSQMNSEGTDVIPSGVETFLLQDPTTFVVTRPKYAIKKGSLDNNFQQYPSTTFTDSMINWTVYTPSANHVIDRSIMMGIPVRFSATGDTGNDNVPLLQYGSLDAMRAFPLSSVTTSLQATINGLTVSIPLNDLFPHLARYTGFQEDEIRFYSQFPSFQDQSQTYLELVNSLINPLGGYPGSSTPYTQTRGGFPIRILTNTRLAATWEVYFLEPIFMAPFLFKHEKQPGFYGVNQFTLTLTLDSQLNKMWSHALLGDNSNAFATFTATMLNLNLDMPWSQNVPTLYVRYAKPNVQLPLNMPYYSPYFLIDRFVTDVGVINARANFQNLTAQSIQLASIPKRMYIMVRRRNQDRTYMTTDTSMVITKIQVTYDNQQKLTTATVWDLYQMSVKNGLQATFPQYCGWGTVDQAGNRTTSFGSILCVDFGDDIGLPLTEAPGMTGNYQLQVKVDGYNPANENIHANLYVIIVQEGIFYTQNLQAFSATGTVTSSDIANSSNLAVHDDVHNTFYGNGVFDIIKKGIGLAAKGFHAAAPYLQTGLKVADNIATTLSGMGRKRRRHGQYGGGASMSISDLRRRLENIE